jgi:hypothetical protein
MSFLLGPFTFPLLRAHQEAYVTTLTFVGLSIRNSTLSVGFRDTLSGIYSYIYGDDPEG